MRWNNHKPSQSTKIAKLSIRDILVILVCFTLSLTMGLLSGDPIVGGLLLVTGLLGGYLASIQKRIGYFFGLANALLIAYVGFENGFYGTFIINILIFAPLEIYGFIAWSHNLNRKRDVKIRRLNRQKSLIVTSACVVGSVMLGYLLTKIPGQQMAFLDSTIGCLDICALLMMNLRYLESWWLWVISSILSVIMWAITFFTGGGPSVTMRLISTISFLIINSYGAIKWSLELKKKKHHTPKTSKTRAQTAKKSR